MAAVRPRRCSSSPHRVHRVWQAGQQDPHSSVETFSRHCRKSLMKVGTCGGREAAAVQLLADGVHRVAEVDGRRDPALGAARLAVDVQLAHTRPQACRNQTKKFDGNVSIRSRYGCSYCKCGAARLAVDVQLARARPQAQHKERTNTHTV